MVMSPGSRRISWLFFKAVRAGLAVKRPYLDPYGPRPAVAGRKQPTGRGPEGCVENGPAAVRFLRTGRGWSLRLRRLKLALMGL